jgi:hypothetical protein
MLSIPMNPASGEAALPELPANSPPAESAPALPNADAAPLVQKVQVPERGPDLPPPSEDWKYAAASLDEFRDLQPPEPEEPAATISPAAMPAENPPETSAGADIQPPRWWHWPLVCANELFDLATVPLGGLGRWLREPRGRTWLGWIGLGLLVAAVAWLVFELGLALDLGQLTR